jgi:hypothetical protein
MLGNVSSPSEERTHKAMQTQQEITKILRVTAHAQQRLAQRGICPAAVDVVRIYGVDSPAGGGCVRRELRQEQVVDLSAGGFSLATIERALRLEAIFSRDEQLVTCYQRAPKRASCRRDRESGRNRVQHRRV